MSVESCYEYAILPLSESDKEQALEFLKRTFFTSEPINQGVGLCRDGERCEDLERYCLADLLSEFSLRAVDAQGNIIAVVVSGLSTISERHHTELAEAAAACTDAKFSRVLCLLAQRERAARLWDKYPAQQVLEVKVAATDPSWGGRGVMTAMVQHTERLARAHRVPLLRMDTSSEYSARVAAKLGFVCVSSLRYQDMRQAGQPLVTPPHPHAHDKVYIKTLQ